MRVGITEQVGMTCIQRTQAQCYCQFHPHAKVNSGLMGKGVGEGLAAQGLQGTRLKRLSP